MATKPRPPEAGDFLGELEAIRTDGVTALRALSLPTLTRLAEQLKPGQPVHTAIETLLRDALDRLGGGSWSDAVGALLGLALGTRGLKITQRRERAAVQLDVAPLTFQRTREQSLLEDLADKLVELSQDGELRQAHAEMSRRHPAESRLAVQWVERFEAYYRIWTPAYALGADLSAYRSTLLEEDRPYDEPPDPDESEDPGYSQDLQAAGYARFALYRFAQYLWELRQFMSRSGGLWLFSNGDTETNAVDAIYRIAWHVTPYNERDESWLRAAMQDARGQEMHTFLQLLTSTSIGQVTQQEWHDWVATCQCFWSNSDDARPDSYFPTRRTEPGIADECQVHRVIEACSDYCDLVDHDWREIADWYHLGEQPRRGKSPDELYREWRADNPLPEPKRAR